MKERTNIPPILLIIFNRLDTTQSVFQAIREARPSQLFIAADGPRTDKEGEAEKCETVRKYVLENIDWNCEVKTLFQDDNLGCGPGPVTAISWFFSHVEEGIILEDDCLPHPDFWAYCRELLDKYRENEHIAVISGNNFQKGKKYGTASCYFSKYGTTWGWATWRRVWKGYQFDLNLLDKDKVWQKIDVTFKAKAERNHWKAVFESVIESNRDIWDYQFLFHIWCNDMFAVVPNVNLVKNIGFGEDATHTFDPDSEAAFIETDAIFPIKHPKQIRVSDKADSYIFSHYFDKRSSLNFLEKIKVACVRILKKIKSNFANE
jgi:hypothetical protein